MPSLSTNERHTDGLVTSTERVTQLVSDFLECIRIDLDTIVEDNVVATTTRTLQTKRDEGRNTLITLWD